MRKAIIAMTVFVPTLFLTGCYVTAADNYYYSGYTGYYPGYRYYTNYGGWGGWGGGYNTGWYGRNTWGHHGGWGYRSGGWGRSGWGHHGGWGHGWHHR